MQIILSNVSDEFEFLYKNTEPLHLIKAAPLVVFSTLYGTFP